MSRGTVRLSLKILRNINLECGGKESKGKEKEPDVDMSKMSAYEKKQYAVALQMKNVREGLQTLEGMGKSGGGERIKVSNAVRSNVQAMKKEAAALKAVAQQEGKMSDYNQLMHHVKKTDDLYRNRDGSKPRPNKLAPETDSFEAPQDLSKPMVSIMEDEEFQTFMVQVREKDKQMEEALTDISKGLERLNVNAQNISRELKKQDQILNEIDKEVDAATEELDAMNKRMKKVLDTVKGDACCMYIMCLLVLLGIIGGIVILVTFK
eukprot:TRINITY_DN67159_c4_g1_i1.p1 TRINITY_DN67159_c4_g1~~TRINITY_DN67159_c4_g1_i1.p1  ORF type:complete len:265 (+),score=26.22 TRINITY_DN67159_c4_g1_i1:41-835(+)